VIFAVLTLIAAWLWWLWLSRRVREQNRRMRRLISAGSNWLAVVLSWIMRWSTDAAYAGGDSSWPVSAESDLPAGSKVEVIAVEGITLRVKAAVE
jgi:membrane protein implicated in regulation of membrane protease activity